MVRWLSCATWIVLFAMGDAAALAQPSTDGGAPPMWPAPSPSTSDGGVEAPPIPSAPTPPAPTPPIATPPTPPVAADPPPSVPQSIAPGHDVLVVVRVTGTVAPEAVLALAEATAGDLAARVLTRTVGVATDDETRASFAACVDDPCRIAIARSRGADLVVVVNLARGTGSTRGQLVASFELVAAEGALPAGAPIALGRTVDARRIAGQVAPALEPIANAIPAPPPPPPPPPTTGTALVVVSNDGARVRVDGRPVGESPLEPLELPPGDHRIEVELAGWVRYRARFTITVGETTRVDVALRRDPMVLRAEADRRDQEADESIPWWRRWYTIGGAAAAVTVITVVVVVAASSGDPEGVPVPGLR